MKLKSFNKFPKGFLDLTKGHMLSQIIGLMLSLIVARLYGPSLLGVFSVYLTSVAVLSTVNTLRLESIFLLKQDSQSVKNNFVGVFGVVLVLTLVFTVAVFFLSNQFIQQFFVSRNVLFLIIFSAFLQSVISLYQNIVVLNEDYKTLKISKVLFTIIRYSAQLLIYYLAVHSLGLIVGYMLALLVLLVFFSKKTFIDWSKFDIYLFKKNVSDFKDILFYALPGDIINSISINIFPLILISFYGDAITGNYFMSFLILTIPLSYLQAVVSPVFFKKSVVLKNTNPKELYSYVSKIVKRIFWFISFPILILLFFGQEIVVFFFGKQWEDTGLFLEIFSFLFVFRLLYSPISSLEETLNKNHISLIVNIYFVCIMLGSVYFGKNIFTIFQIAKFISVTTALGYVFLLIYVLRTLKKVQ